MVEQNNSFLFIFKHQIIFLVCCLVAILATLPVTIASVLFVSFVQWEAPIWSPITWTWYARLAYGLFWLGLVLYLQEAMRRRFNAEDEEGSQP